MYGDGTMLIIALTAAAVVALSVFGVFRFRRKKIAYGFLIGFGAALVLLFFTLQKINKMNVLVGESAGRKALTKTVTRKSRESFRSKGSSYSVPKLCFQDGGEVCVDVEGMFWTFKNVGDRITVFSVPGDDEFYHPTGQYLDDGNFAFDYFLLLVEALGALFCFVKMLFPRFLALDKFGKSNNIKIFDAERDRAAE